MTVQRTDLAGAPGDVTARPPGDRATERATDRATERPLDHPRATVDGEAEPGREPAAADETPTDAAALLDALATGVLIASRGEIAFVNAAAERILGTRAAELCGRPLFQALPVLGGAAELALARQTQEDGCPRGWRRELRGDRSVRVVDVRSSRGREGSLVLELTDVTTTAQLEREHERLLDGVGEALLVLDGDWRVTLWNAAAARMTRVPADSIVGRRLGERFPGIVGTSLRRLLRAVLAERRSGELRNWHYAGDAAGAGRGTYDVRAHPMEGGGALVLFVEVTARERRELELAQRAEENEWLRELVRQMAAVTDSAAMLNVLCGSALRHCAADGACVAQLRDGYSELLAQDGGFMGPPGMRFSLAGSLTEVAIRRGAPVAAGNYSSEFPDRAERLGLAAYGPMLVVPLVAHERVLGILTVARRLGGTPFSEVERQRVGVIADHAALVIWKTRLLEEAQQANEAKAAFLMTMSHELRTPLAALTGYGELLEDEIVGALSREQHDVVERMRSVTHHLSSMIEEVLTYSSLEAGRELVRPVPVRVADTVRAALAVVEPLARSRRLALSAALPEQEVMLTADPDKLRQILVNLLGNAVKFTERGSVDLRVSRAPDALEFAVRDTGIGIAAAELPRLFQPFGQLDAGLTRRHNGTGLGLYISRRLARLMGGDIVVESEPGVGSTFTVRLPV